MMQLSDEDGVTNCADAVRLFYLNGLGEMYAVFPSQATWTYISGPSCVYVVGNTQSGDPLYFGAPGGNGCARLFEQSFLGGNYFYFRLGPFYLAYNGTHIVLDDFEGDLFYRDVGYPGKQIHPIPL